MDNKEKVTVEKSPSKASAFFKNVGGFFVDLGKTLWRWTKRMFMGASKDIAPDFSVEAIESPGKMAIKSFFGRKIALVAFVILIAMFIFVFIGPAFVPVDFSMTDSKQANVAPITTLMAVPSELKNDIKTITGIGTFTMGLSNSGKIYIWGDTNNRVSNIDYSVFPDAVKNEKVVMLSAGQTHIAALTESGKLVMWGDNSQGQYGVKEGDTGILSQPQFLIDGTLDVNQVEQLVCGNGATALVMKDGKVYIWGNLNAVNNIDKIAKLTNVKKIAFTSAYAVALLDDGTLTTGGGNEFTLTEINERKAVDIVGSSWCVAAILKDGNVLVTGTSKYDEDKVPEKSADEKFVAVAGGSNHFVGVTDKGTVYSWGDNFYKQSSVNGATGYTSVYAGCNQSYAATDGKLTKTFGLKGFPMGTDKMGRDVFTRIVHGGRMTMTIGAVAVIISTVIAIIVGCLSGYFGGWVDMLLMRITEIFSAIPFLPFAMMLSVVMRTMDISENGRIFVIMCILGVLSWTGLARMIRGQVLAEREKEFVTAAKAMGVREGRIAFKHILPNIISVILVSVTLDFAGCMLTESSLSYLGFGVKEPQPTWGNMLNGSNNSIVIQNYWWQWLFPALFLGIATICVNIIGDTLRDVLDPRSTKEK